MGRRKNFNAMKRMEKTKGMLPPGKTDGDTSGSSKNSAAAGTTTPHVLGTVPPSAPRKGQKQSKQIIVAEQSNTTSSSLPRSRIRGRALEHDARCWDGDGNGDDGDDEDDDRDRDNPEGRRRKVFLKSLSQYAFTRPSTDTRAPRAAAAATTSPSPSTKALVPNTTTIVVADKVPVPASQLAPLWELGETGNDEFRHAFGLPPPPPPWFRKRVARRERRVGYEKGVGVGVLDKTISMQEKVMLLEEKKSVEKTKPAEEAKPNPLERKFDKPDAKALKRLREEIKTQTTSFCAYMKSIPAVARKTKAQVWWRSIRKEKLQLVSHDGPTVFDVLSCGIRGGDDGTEKKVMSSSTSGEKATSPPPPPATPLPPPPQPPPSYETELKNDDKKEYDTLLIGETSFRQYLSFLTISSMSDHITRSAAAKAFILCATANDRRTLDVPGRYHDSDDSDGSYNDDVDKDVSSPSDGDNWTDRAVQVRAKLGHIDLLSFLDSVVFERQVSSGSKYTEEKEREDGLYVTTETRLFDAWKKASRREIEAGRYEKEKEDDDEEEKGEEGEGGIWLTIGALGGWLRGAGNSAKWALGI